MEGQVWLIYHAVTKEAGLGQENSPDEILWVAGPSSDLASHPEWAHLDKSARFPQLAGLIVGGGQDGIELFPK